MALHTPRKAVGRLLLALATSLLLLTPLSGWIPSSTAVESQPSGNWSISAIPYLGPGFEARPVVVGSVVSDAVKGFRITKAGLKNVSSKQVTAVKLGWRVTAQQARGTVLAKGQTPLVAISGGIPTDGTHVLKYPIFTFAEVYKSLLKGGTLEGRYKVEVLVTEIIFEDGSTWADEPGKTSGVAFLKTTLRGTPVAPLVVTPLRLNPQVGCPKQECDFVSGPPLFWTCKSSDDAVFCTNCGVSCCGTACGVAPSCDCV